MARKRYWAYELTGGTAGAMDAIDGASLSVGDICEVINATTVDKFYLDESGDTESSPRCIAPDSNAGDKRWKLIGQTMTSDCIKYEVPNDGLTDASTALNAAISALSNGDSFKFDSGTYLLNSDVDSGEKHIIWEIPSNAVFTGDGDIIGSKYTQPDPGDGLTIIGRVVIRGETDNPLSKTGMSATNNFSAAGQSLRIDNKSCGGTAMIMFSNNEAPPVIGTPIYTANTDIHVTLHSHTTQTPDIARVWGINPVVVKSYAIADTTEGASKAVGIEVSMSNNTSETGTPMGAGAVDGLWVSYIHTSNNGTAAITTGSLVAADGVGWLFGLNIDGIDPVSGVGIRLNDDVSPNLGMKTGIDISNVNSFVTAAVLMGNTHDIAWKGSGGTVRSCLQLSSSNYFEVGSTAVQLKLKNAGSSLFMQGVATSTSATAGTRTLPANPVGFLHISLDDGSTTYKIPFYAE